jgi:hypothetical protein
VQIANLVLEDTWNRFKKSSAYDKFCDLYSSSAQTQDLDALADDRRHFNVVQIMHRSGKQPQNSVDCLVHDGDRSRLIFFFALFATVASVANQRQPQQATAVARAFAVRQHGLNTAA